jgi:hypothetical protein
MIGDAPGRVKGRGQRRGIITGPGGTPFVGLRNTRGATFTTLGTGFLQTPLDVADLLDINASYGTTFSTFSDFRIFTPLGSNITEATFSIPGTGGAVPATVAGFGAVFTDVERSGSSTIEFFDPSDASLGLFNVPTVSVSDGGLSFLGVLFDAGERIARVRIMAGDVALGPDDDPTGGVDVAAMDNFIYAEPQAIPEPPSLILAAIGGVGLVSVIRRRRRA